MRILERGLWTASLARSGTWSCAWPKKQGAEFRLLAPDEPEARARSRPRIPSGCGRERAFIASLFQRDKLFDVADAEVTKRLTTRM